MDDPRIDALEKTATRHEAVIEMLRKQLSEIHEGVARIEVTMASRAPAGESHFCRTHLSAIEALERKVEALKAEVDTVKAWVWKGLGGLAVLMIIVTLVGPTVVEKLAASASRPMPHFMGGTP